MRLGDVAYARQPRDGPLLVRGGVHPVLRAQQAAQQRRVLACMPLSLFAPEPCSHERPIKCPRRHKPQTVSAHLDHHHVDPSFSTFAIAVMVFQLRVVAGTPKSRSSMPR